MAAMRRKGYVVKEKGVNVEGEGRKGRDDRAVVER